jgi:hypothetical protein
MSALMASKLAAIFLRGTRGVGGAIYEEKGRDIYDLLWYMSKRIVPDFDYLTAKGIDAKNPRALFDKITLRLNKVSDENLKQDLSPLFINRVFIEHWLQNWRTSYLQLLDNYEIQTMTKLESIGVYQDFHTDNFSFAYRYKTEDGGSVRVIYNISEYWFMFRDGDLPVEINDKITDLISDDTKIRIDDKLKQYITLFYEKTESYLKKTNHVVLGNNMSTKTIRMTADNLNQKEEIVLNKSALLSCELDDLLK